MTVIIHIQVSDELSLNIYILCCMLMYVHTFFAPYMILMKGWIRA